MRLAHPWPPGPLLPVPGFVVCREVAARIVRMGFNVMTLGTGGWVHGRGFVGDGGGCEGGCWRWGPSLGSALTVLLSGFFFCFCLALPLPFSCNLHSKLPCTVFLHVRPSCAFCPVAFRPVCCIPADAMLHHDPYIFLKSPPLANYTALFQRDGPDGHGGWAGRGGVGVGGQQPTDERRQSGC